MVNGVLLRPLPYREADRIMTLWQTNAVRGAVREQVSPANFMDWRDRQKSFAQIAAVVPYGFDLTGQGEPESLGAWQVTGGFFEILGVNALYGRTFRPEDFQAGNECVVIPGPAPPNKMDAPEKRVPSDEERGYLHASGSRPLVDKSLGRKTCGGSRIRTMVWPSVRLARSSIPMCYGHRVRIQDY